MRLSVPLRKIDPHEDKTARLHAEIARRYDWAARQAKLSKRFTIGARIIADLYLFIGDQFGALSLPDDDWGRDILWELLNQHALAGASRTRMRRISIDLLPEMTDGELDSLIDMIGSGRKRKADDIARAIGLDFETRDKLDIRAIGATDKTKEERAAIYALLAACNKEREREQARAKAPARCPGRPRTRGEPWLAPGVSKATWYRHHSNAGVETKPRETKFRRHSLTTIDDADNFVSAARQAPPTTVAERGTAADSPAKAETKLAPKAPSQPRWSPPNLPRIPDDVIRALKGTPLAHYGRVFDPASAPAWAMPMQALAVAVAAGKPPSWLQPMLRSLSRRAAA